MGANTKQLRNRIKSVDSTLHLTRAMGLVASSKLRRAMENMNKGRQYEAAVRGAIEPLDLGFVKDERRVVLAGGNGADAPSSLTARVGHIEIEHRRTEVTFEIVVIPKAEKNERFDRLCELQNRISEQIHEGYVGKTFRCLVDGADKDLLTARTEGGRLVRFAGCDSLISTYQNIKITGSTTWSLTGEL